MDFGDQTTLYDLLDLTPDATPSEIREAYIRIKNTYQKDSPALYSLMDSSEGTEMLGKIEQAYEILSNSQKRKEYDRNFGQIGLEPPNVFSIDRRPPMEPVEDDSILIAPPTDHGQVPGAFSRAPEISPPERIPARQPPSSAPPLHPPLAAAMDSPPAGASGIDSEIRSEQEWSGPFLRKVRESRGLGPEDIMAATRIAKVYLLAIEAENFAKLPAPVYIRGFIMQISRLLKLPADRVTAAYLERYRKACPGKFQN